MNLRVILSALVLVMGCSSWVAAQAGRGNPQAGQMIYENNCLRCHGEKLDGAGPEGRYLIVRPANLQSAASRAKTDWELLITISHGAAALHRRKVHREPFQAAAAPQPGSRSKNSI